MTMASVGIGTRASDLAMVQAGLARDALGPLLGPTRLVPFTTRGDEVSARRPDAAWVEVDGQFTRDLEDALLRGDIDVAVHSYKDLPTAGVDGLVVAAVLPRADVRDCLIARDRVPLADLPMGARIGTSSPRRAGQLHAARPDIVAVPVRGNVPTRIARVAAGELDGVILAAAGLDRLGIPVPDGARLPLDVMLPAPAQGALAVQVREADADLIARVAHADHAATRIAVGAERALLRHIGGGCLAPLGAFAEVSRDGLLRLRAAHAGHDGWRRADVRGSAEDVIAVVEAAAQQLVLS